jgi:hypothetical protein
VAKRSSVCSVAIPRQSTRMPPTVGVHAWTDVRPFFWESVQTGLDASTRVVIPLGGVATGPAHRGSVDLRGLPRREARCRATAERRFTQLCSEVASAVRLLAQPRDFCYWPRARPPRVPIAPRMPPSRRCAGQWGQLMMLLLSSQTLFAQICEALVLGQYVSTGPP